VSEPESVQARAFTGAAKLVAGRISIIADEMRKAMEEEEKKEAENPKPMSGTNDKEIKS
jgi:hypothetical protein